MRALQIAIIAATLTIPSAGYSQDQGLVGGKVGPGLESSTTNRRPSSSWANPYAASPRAPQERAGFAGAVWAGQVVSHDTPVTQQWGGMGTAYVNGHRVQVDPNTGRITRVLN
jgi:hypothetical protein